MKPTELERYNHLYEQHLTNLTLQGKRPATIDAYSRAVRRISQFFDRCPDAMTTADLKQYFASLIQTHSWSTVKLDRNGLQFFYRHTLEKEWQWLDIVKPPQSKKLPDIITAQQVALLISMTKQKRYQIFFLTLYTMGLRLGEGLSLTVHDIDQHTMQVHIRDGKGGKDRLVPVPQRTLNALRAHWLTHLLEQGLDLRSLQILLGHASLNTTARYTRMTQIKQRDAALAINRLADALTLMWEAV
ncbi:tyrosine-type recombinase/integrase [Photobacterium profundum]|uniref:Integrase n=1 Tax=Photobacterium profundum (strain SS9) TaxID=298386 RepID=Q6LIY7_PHOPR|nr:site-specific integrase [Photobacterium profundum]CAG22743.1 hypothetical protein PBPRB0871 [Photobacterium profundum SS9]